MIVTILRKKEPRMISSWIRVNPKCNGRCQEERSIEKREGDIKKRGYYKSRN
jgi:hypothetical protein